MIKVEVLTTEYGCKKCERAMKVVQKVMDTYKKKIHLVKIDVTKHPEKLIKYNVMSTPAVIINNTLVGEGSLNEKELSRKIREVLK